MRLADPDDPLTALRPTATGVEPLIERKSWTWSPGRTPVTSKSGWTLLVT